MQVVHQRVPDDLVDRVVPTDVLAHDEDLAVGRRERGSVQPAGTTEHRLLLAHEVRQRREDLDVDPHLAAHGRHRRDDRVDLVAAAQPAGARRRRHAAEPREVDVDGVAHHDRDVAARPGPPSPSRQGRTPARSSRDRTTPSPTARPAPSSRSWPGVRIVDPSRCSAPAVLDVDVQRLLDHDDVAARAPARGHRGGRPARARPTCRGRAVAARAVHDATVPPGPWVGRAPRPRDLVGWAHDSRGSDRCGLRRPGGGGRPRRRRRRRRRARGAGPRRRARLVAAARRPRRQRPGDRARRRVRPRRLRRDADVARPLRPRASWTPA